MKRKILITLMAAAFALGAKAKTLVAYYSFTSHVEAIVNDLAQQIDADFVRIEPAEKGLDYAANGYAIGSALIQAINDRPNDATSYPAIDEVKVGMENYETVIIATPLWWSHMAAPMQTFLFQHGKEMAGKHVGLIVSSASSGISTVVADAKRLVPEGSFLTPNLWIRSSQTNNCHALTAKWLEDIGYGNLVSGMAQVNSTLRCSLVRTATGFKVEGAAVRISIFNASGHRVLQCTDGLVDTTSWTPGVYVAQMEHEGGTVCHQKLLVR